MSKPEFAATCCRGTAETSFASTRVTNLSSLDPRTPWPLSGLYERANSFIACQGTPMMFVPLLARRHEFELFSSPLPVQIYCLALMNGVVATGSLDCRIKLCDATPIWAFFQPLTLKRRCSWKLQTGELLQTLQGHKGDVLAMQQAPSHLFSASVDRTIRKWKFLPDFSILETDSSQLHGHSAAVELLALGGPTANVLVSAGSDKTIRVRCLLLLSACCAWLMPPVLCAGLGCSVWRLSIRN